MPTALRNPLHAPPEPPPSCDSPLLPPLQVRTEGITEDDDRQLMWTAEMIAKEELYKANEEKNKYYSLSVCDRVPSN